MDIKVKKLKKTKEMKQKLGKNEFLLNELDLEVILQIFFRKKITLHYFWSIVIGWK